MIPDWFTQRVSTHPSLVEGVSDLPSDLRDVAEGALPPTAEVESIFAVPLEYYSRGFWGWRYVPERGLIFTDRGVLHVYGRAGRGALPAAQFLPADCLVYVRSSLLLLYGLLEFAVVDGEQLRRVALEYNTVGWHLLEKPLKQLVSRMSGRELASPGAERAANEELLRPLPYKFANGLRYYALAPGEVLLGATFQPAIWDGRFGPFQREITPHTLLALTDRNLIVIEESRALFRRSNVEYGWIISFIPRHAVTGSECRPLGPDREELRLDLGLGLGPAGETRRFVLTERVAAAWQAVWSDRIPPAAPAGPTARRASIGEP